jgi:hypothetical protein
VLHLLAKYFCVILVLPIFLSHTSCPVFPRGIIGFVVFVFCLGISASRIKDFKFVPCLCLTVFIPDNLAKDEFLSESPVLYIAFVTD